MMEENRAEQLFFLWEKISEGEIRLLRVFGEQPVVTVRDLSMEDVCGNWAIIAFQEESFRRMRSGIQGTAEVCGRAVCLC